MSRLSSCVLVLTALGCASAGTQGAGAPTPSAPQQAGARSPQSPAQAGATQGASRGTYRDFADLTKDAVARVGFLDTYEKDGALYLVVPPQRLGQEFLMYYEIAQGIGASGLFGGTMLNIFEGNLVALERHADRVYLVKKPHRFRARPGSPEERAVELTFGSSVLESAKIESVRKDSAVVINIQDWMLSDLSDIGSRIRSAVAPRPGQPGRATIDRNRSYLESVKAFPQNLNVRAKLTFVPGEPVFLNSVPDSRYIPITIHYTFAQLPVEPMTPRLGDDRMGYFMTVHKNFSSDDETFFVRYVNRWRLEPDSATCSGGLCEPKKAIVYYIDRNVPVEVRPYMKAGVEAWAKAFEAAGFRNAIRAEMLPDGADAEDIRYPTLRWNASDQPGYGAIGPSIVDPRTGEILDADILFEASFLQGMKHNWRTLVSPQAAVDAMFDVSDDEQALLAAGGELSTFAASLASQGALVKALLTAQGDLDPDAPLPEQFLGQGWTWVTMHEVGHTLGLRHNFRSSTDTPMDKLGDREFAERNGLFSSVMEYPSVNLSANGSGYYYTPGVGSSDRWVISYGYTPDADRAKQIAREAARPGHAFGSDDDARGPGALDPTVNTWDLGADPLAWGKERAQLVSSLWAKLPDRMLTDDSRYARLTDAFNSLLYQYAQALAMGVKYIGGQYMSRDHVGDPGGRPPFAPVHKAKQREALEFLNSAAFGEDAFVVPREVLARLGANRWAHWGENTTFDGRIDYPLHERVLGVQKTLVNQVLNPFVFARIRDAEMKFGAAQVLTIPELMRDMTMSVWAEVYEGQGRSVRAMRRDLQRAHLDRMSEIVIGAPARLPADARSVARYQLADLKRRLDARLSAGGGTDAYTRAHFAEASSRIGKVMAAGLDDVK